MSTFRKSLKSPSDLTSSPSTVSSACPTLSRNGAMEFPEIIILLIEHGADYNAFESANNRHLLHLAAASGSVALAEFLLSRGSDPNSKNTEKRTALFLAAHDNNIPLVELLLSGKHGAKANVNDVDATNSSALLAASRKGHSEMIKILLAAGAQINAQDAELWSSLHWACRNGHVEAARVLCTAGANINAVEKMSATPLQLAVIVDQPDIAELLISSGANLEFKGKNGFTPIHLASVKGSVRIVRSLLRKGASVSEITSNGCTPLHLSALSGHVEIGEMLVSAGADVDSQESSGQTALHLAASKNHVEFVSFLLSSGADSDILDNSSLLALHIAISRGLYDIATLVIDNNPAALMLDSQAFNLNQLWKIAIEEQNWPFATALLRSALTNDMVVKRDRSIDTKAASKIGISSSSHSDLRLHITEYDSTLEQALQNCQLDFAELLIQTREISDDEVVNHKQLGHVRRSSMKKIAKLLGGEFDMESGIGMSDNTSRPPSARAGSATGPGLGISPSFSMNGGSGNGAGALGVISNASGTPSSTSGRSNSLRGSFVNTDALQSFSLIRIIDPSNKDTFVHYAVRSHNTELLEKLIYEGYSLNVRLSRSAGMLHLGNAPLASAAGSNGSNAGEVAEVLLMPIHHACAEGHVEIVEMLLQNGAYINAREMYNNRILLTNASTISTDSTLIPKMPLYYACERGHLPVVELLVQSGASLKEPHFSACLAIAEERNHFDICTFLEKAAFATSMGYNPHVHSSSSSSGVGSSSTQPPPTDRSRAHKRQASVANNAPVSAPVHVPVISVTPPAPAISVTGAPQADSAVLSLLESQTELLRQQGETLSKIGEALLTIAASQSAFNATEQLQQMEVKLALMQKENNQLRSVSLTTEKILQRANAKPALAAQNSTSTVKDKAAMFGPSGAPTLTRHDSAVPSRGPTMIPSSPREVLTAKTGANSHASASMSGSSVSHREANADGVSAMNSMNDDINISDYGVNIAYLRSESSSSQSFDMFNLSTDEHTHVSPAISTRTSQNQLSMQ